ncbi:MAG TPA: sigma-70 family RNA polymerase sigma factor [Ohtaekwangia sp.]|uniref:RNA polymerase sigma factor n=1 Tax=Ohtaekwangia sp. TaxID=2066019 RepID=UPI002F92D2B4
MTYQEIISLIETKNRKGWEELFHTYGQKFYGFAIKNWGFDEDQAWDIVYQTLETILLKIGDYEIQSQAHFDNLLFKIFTNFLRQYYRKIRKANTYDFLSVEEVYSSYSEPDDEPSLTIKEPFSNDFFTDYLESGETANEKLKFLEDALEKLEKQEKELLLLKANGFTYDQIAGMLNIENNQLKVKHHRAKNKLIKLLQA